MKSNDNISISTIILAYNSDAFIGKAIDSVLSQDIKPLEIIVIDDGSSDRTKEICSRYKSLIKYQYQSNGGEGSARNLGLKISKGELIAYLDADDEWLPNTLQLLRNPFLRNESNMLSIGYSQEVRKISQEWLKDQKPYIGQQLSATMIRREAFDIVGLFNEELRLAVDTDWLFRIREFNLLIEYINQTVVYHRRHSNNATLCNELVQSSLLTACRASINRRREKGIDPFLPQFGHRRSIL
jgi:glycosyltransferase involved in cell wall biosynthesis